MILVGKMEDKFVAFLLVFIANLFTVYQLNLMELSYSRERQICMDYVKFELTCHEEAKKILSSNANKKILDEARENPSVVGQLCQQCGTSGRVEGKF